MQDLANGPIARHLLKTTSFMLVTMVFQTLYFLVDLYWVGRLGTQAVAAVGIAGNLTFIVLALTQMLGVGTTAVVSHAAGRKDRPQALLLFNQSQVLAMVTGVGHARHDLRRVGANGDEGVRAKCFGVFDGEGNASARACSHNSVNSVISPPPSCCSLAR